jgi:hypothetical protein
MKTKYWILIFAFILLASAAASYFFMNRKQSGTVVGVYQNSKLIRTIDLSTVTEPYEFTLTDGERSNTIRVDEEGIRIVSASCRDQICVHHGVLSSGTPIVCLPNRVVIKWMSGENLPYDAITGI